ncbi:MAG TPA: hypothetical protein VIH93_07415, partial [Thermoanaerobaculia bacterium]
WVIHFADSPTCDGGGGDAGTTTHDAETYLTNGTTFQMMGTYDYAHATLDPWFSESGIVSASGCYQTHWIVQEGAVTFDDNTNTTGSPKVVLNTIHGFATAPYKEADSEDPSGADANLWYVGVNRTVYRADRSGSGANKVCLVLSQTTTPDPAAIAALCGG